MIAWLFSGSPYDELADTLEQSRSSQLGRSRNIDIRRTRVELIQAAQTAIRRACASSQPLSPRRLIKRLGGSEKACVLLSLLSVDANFDSDLSSDEEKAFVKMADRLIGATSNFHLNAGVVAALVLSVLFPLAYEEDDTIIALDAEPSWLSTAAFAESELG